MKTHAVYGPVTVELRHPGGSNEVEEERMIEHTPSLRYVGDLHGIVDVADDRSAGRLHQSHHALEFPGFGCPCDGDVIDEAVARVLFDIGERNRDRGFDMAIVRGRRKFIISAGDLNYDPLIAFVIRDQQVEPAREVWRSLFVCHETELLLERCLESGFSTGAVLGLVYPPVYGQVPFVTGCIEPSGRAEENDMFVGLDVGEDRFFAAGGRYAIIASKEENKNGHYKHFLHTRNPYGRDDWCEELSHIGRRG